LHTARGPLSGILIVSSRINALTSRNIDMNGTIKRLVSDKGFGFIAAGDGTEYFFHQSACTGTAFDQLREGQAVTFDVGHGAKGPRFGRL
jgi:CspA family cold shock protein